MKALFKGATVLIISSLVTLQAFAHGEDKPGPNGGYIRMPGGFHTELVQANNQKFKVYLLDINWQNPTVRDSSVEANVEFKSESIAASCKPEANFFSCELPKGKSLKSAKNISLKSVREKMAGILVKYDLPLRFSAH